MQGALVALGISQDQAVTAAAAMAPLMLYHFVSPNYPASSITTTPISNPTYLSRAVPGSPNVTFYSNGSSVLVSSIGSDAVVTASVQTANYTLHVINQLLVPFFVNLAQALSRNPQTSLIAKYAVSLAPRLVSTLQNPLAEYTIFIPNNDAFSAAALSGFFAVQDGYSFFLRAHIVPKPLIYAENITTTPMNVTTLAGVNLTIVRTSAGDVTVSTAAGIIATVTLTNVRVGFTLSGAPRSLVHIIDKMLIPAATPVPPFGVRPDVTTILAAIRADPAFAATVNGSSPDFPGTLLLPTDAALTKFLANNSITAAQLLEKPLALRAILELHVLPNTAVKVATLTNGQKLNTTNNTLTVGVSNVTGVVTFSFATSNASVVGGMEYAVGNFSTAIIIDAALFPSDWTINYGTTQPGAGFMAVAPPLGVFLSSAIAFLVLHMFSNWD